MGLEDNLDHMIWIGECTTSLNRTYTFKEVSKMIKNVKADDIRRMAAKIFKNNNINLAVVGPQVEKADKEIKKISYLD